MKMLLISMLFTLFLCACENRSSLPAKEGVPAPTNESTGTAVKKPVVGDDVIYMFDEYHFYEAKLSAIDGTKAKLLREGSNYERDMSDVYLIPKSGDNIGFKEGDYVAARFGKLPTWPTAKVLKVSGDKITIKRIISGSVEEISPENVLAVSPEAAAKIKDAAAKKGI